MFTTIRARLTLSHIAVIVIAMSLSGLLLLSLLERYFIQAVENGLAAQARITATALVPGAMVEGAPEALEDAAYNTIQQQRSSNWALQAQNVAPGGGDLPIGSLDLSYLANASLQLSSELETRIRILDGEGMVLLDSSQEQTGLRLLEDPLVNLALSGQYATVTDRTSPEPEMHVAMPLVFDGELVGAVYLSQSLGDVVGVLSDLRLLWLLSTLLALVLSVVVGLFLSRAIARPLNRITGAVEAVARGNLEHRVPVGARDELGRLSQAFNEMASRLQAARDMQIAFVANVSHDLRTPLTAVKGMVETLRDGAVDDAQVRDRFLETVESETDRLIRLVNDLLILSRADSQALNLRREELDLAQLVQVVMDRLAPQADVRNVSLQLSLGSELEHILADRDRIDQVLVNLLDNAIKYSHPGGLVLVRVDQDDGCGLRITVEDQGIGIPEAELPRIGERFYRVDRARARAAGGSGLGLAIAGALIAAHGGQLQLESKLGQGTSATFSLPAA